MSTTARGDGFVPRLAQTAPRLPIRSALRLLEDRELQLRALREALEAGERSGASTPFDFDAFLDRKRTESSRDR